MCGVLERISVLERIIFIVSVNLIVFGMLKHIELSLLEIVNNNGRFP